MDLTTTTSHTPPDVLLVSGDPSLVVAVEEVAAAAGVPVTPAVPEAVSRPVWDGARLVVVGADVLTAPAPVVLHGRRAGVVAAGLDPVPDGVWRGAVEVGAEHVAVLPAAATWLAERMAEAVEARERPGLVVGVVAGCGGAGASVLATAMARTAAAQGLRTVLVDADRLGGGLDLVLGAEDAAGARWPDLSWARGRLPPDVLAGLLPVVDGVSLLSWGRAGGEPGAGGGLGAPDVAAETVRAVLGAASAGSDVVVVDLPRVLGPDSAGAVAAGWCDVVLVVVLAQVRGVAAAARVLEDLSAQVADARLAVRLTRGGRMDAPTVADALAVPLAAVLRPEPGLEAALDRGEPPGVRPRGPLTRVCKQLLADLVRPGVTAWSR